MSRRKQKRSVRSDGSVRSDRSWIALVLLAIAVYLPSLGGEFLWDDNSSVTESEIVHDPSGWWKAWVAPPRSHPDYFPLTTTSFWLQWRLWGMNPVGYRWVSVLLHAGCAVLLFRLLRELKLPGAWLAAALVAVHPVNVESVAWIAEQKNLLCLIFALPAFQYFVRWHRDGAARDYQISLACHVAALAAKASVVGLPLAFAAYLFWRGVRPGKRELLALAPFLACSLGFGVLVMQFQHGRAVGAWDIAMPSLLGRIGGAAVAFWFYVGKALWPLSLATIYPRWPLDPPPLLHLLLALATGAGLVALWLRPGPRARALAFAFTVYGLLLGPALGLIKMSFMRHGLVADHFQHLALPALVSVLVCGGVGWIETQSPRVRQAAVWGFGLLAVLFAGLSWHRAGLHGSHEALWKDALAKNPASDQPHNILGAIAANRGDFREAEKHLRRAVERGSPEAVVYLGSVLCSTGRFEEALPWLEKGVAAGVNASEAYLQLSRAYVGLNRTEEALRTLHAGVERYPDSLLLNSSLGMAYLLAQDPARALGFLERCEKLSPRDAATKLHLAQALAGLGRGSEAARKQSEAFRLDPKLARQERK